MKHERIRISRLGRMLALYRASRQMGLRETAKEIGTSAATLSRIERGYALNAKTLITVWTWLLADEVAL